MSVKSPNNDWSDHCHNQVVFSKFSDLDLVEMQHEAREYPEDTEFVKAILSELKRREVEYNYD